MARIVERNVTMPRIEAYSKRDTIRDIPSLLKLTPLTISD